MNDFDIIDGLKKPDYETAFEFDIIDGLFKHYKGKPDNVVIPEGVKTIGAQAFQMNRNIVSVIIPEGVTEIEDEAFEGCYNLSSIILPQTLEVIDEAAFDSCSNLTEISLPKGLKYLGKNAFAHCSGLKKITVPANTEIGNYAFNDCKTLTSVTISEGVKTIPEGALLSCESLLEIHLPESLSTIEKNAFHGCKSLSSVSLPEGLMSIGENAFGECENLKSITIPEKITSINKEVFSGCYELMSVNFPEGLLSIKEKAFSSCNNLSSVTLPSGLEKIGSGAFEGCRKVSSLFIPKSVTIIGSGNTQGNDKLASITVEKDNPVYDSRNGCNAIIETKTNTLVSGCRKTKIPSEIRRIGNNAFAELVNLKEIIIPEQVESIGKEAFANCYLKSLVLPESLERIGSMAFSSGNSLKSIIILKREIKDNNRINWTESFQACHGLKELTAPYLSFSTIYDMHVELPAARGFIKNNMLYKSPAIISEYINYISDNIRKLIPVILAEDAVEILKKLYEAGKITKTNIQKNYIDPSEKTVEAEKCRAYLSELGDKLGRKADGTVVPDRPKLWDDIHFSLDGKKLKQYPEKKGRKVYDVPEGTQEIGMGAFLLTPLTEIRLPESVTVIRKGAFGARYNQPLYVKLPDNMKNLSVASIFRKGLHSDYYVETPYVNVARQIVFTSESDGNRFPVCTGGKLISFLPKEKHAAVQGFLCALKKGIEYKPEIREGYLEHIRHNQKTYLKQAADDEVLFYLMIDEKLLSKTGSKQLLEILKKNKRTDLTIRLLAYQNEQFSGEMMDDELGFDDAKVRKMVKMAERRENIRNQKGIKGLAFVVSGYLRNFGLYDFWGNRSLADLKRYIEARGGYLRSSISSKTDYLICNDHRSNSTKCKAAKDLGIPVITEDEFLKMAEETPLAEEDPAV